MQRLHEQEDQVSEVGWWEAIAGAVVFIACCALLLLIPA